LQNGFTGPELVRSAHHWLRRDQRLVLVRMLYLLAARVFAWLVLLSRSSANRRRLNAPRAEECVSTVTAT
ncbi:MAG: hypothetical protein M3332_15155, partial [Actinomycetota bacterium]|nr:hypothetical protein [Actinomycetota bacterium]